MSSKVKTVTRSLSLPRDLTVESERGNPEMVATLQSRKEALEAKILEKNEELKRLCLQEADLTGVMPPEIPLEPGEPPPPIRRRVGTSFSFPQNLINNVKDADDESLTALELECRVQINIAEAALALANDSSANKAARRKHRLMYRQSQRRLMELETRLNLLRQGKSHQLKSQQIKKKPRPNTTAVENLGFLFKKNNDQSPNYFTTDHLGSWPGKAKPNYSLEDRNREFNRQNDVFGSLQRSFKSGGTSQSSNSPKTDISIEELKLGTYQLLNSAPFTNNFISNSLSYTNMQSESGKVSLVTNPQHEKRNGKKGVVRRQWDTQSAAGTLLPSQTYPEHSHQPNLSRTQSLGSVESNSQKSKDSWSVQDLSYEGNNAKEKEWYETSLDSAPSPPLRTTSRLPSTARMLYQMQETNWTGNNAGMQSSASHPALSTTPNMMLKNYVKTATEFPHVESRNTGVDTLTNSIQQLHLNSNKKGKNLNAYVDNFSNISQKEIFYNGPYDRGIEGFDYTNVSTAPNENIFGQTEMSAVLDISYPSTSNDPRFFQNNEPSIGLPFNKQNSNQTKFKTSCNNDQYNKGHDNALYMVNNNLYNNISEDHPDGHLKSWLNEEEFPNQIKSGQIAVPQEYVAKPQTPTQPYYHMTKHSSGEKIKNLQYQAAKNRQATIAEEQINNKSPSPHYVGTHHPPHAIVQNEISFDTVVPFESPQNHTVVQAGKWQPYREVTKPFEMSDFYKYSTKFRQNQAQANRAMTPDVTTNSSNTIHQKGIYTPLKPMTCKPVESKCNQVMMQNQVEVECDEAEKAMVEVSAPEIV